MSIRIHGVDFARTSGPSGSEPGLEYSGSGVDFSLVLGDPENFSKENIEELVGERSGDRSGDDDGI